MADESFLKQQLITYMGNKRKLIYAISQVVQGVEQALGSTSLTFGDGFSGSGVVSRLFKSRGTTLYTNDLAGYSETLARCFLATPSERTRARVRTLIASANSFADDPEGAQVTRWVAEHWAPSGKIRRDHRVFFTEENGNRIDRYRAFIERLPAADRPFLLAPLLVESSIHNNTSGQFSAFYKCNGVGAYGGKKSIDIKRITKAICLPLPTFDPNPCVVTASRLDANEWAKTIPPLDLVYYDPPYNQHPYSIYYFMLDIINDWDTSAEIPDTTRGQPKTWKRSPYNSFVDAENAFIGLIDATKAKFILLSYNSRGIIPLEKLERILRRKGKLTKIPVEHRTYNKMTGIAAYKRKVKKDAIQEFLWLVDCR
jgi:adenine-specific DNA-methyltransferase